MVQRHIGAILRAKQRVEGRMTVRMFLRLVAVICLATGSFAQHPEHPNGHRAAEHCVTMGGWQTIG